MIQSILWTWTLFLRSVLRKPIANPTQPTICWAASRVIVSYILLILTTSNTYKVEQYWVPAQSVISYLLRCEWSTTVWQEIQFQLDYCMGQEYSLCKLGISIFLTYHQERERVILDIALLLTPLFQLSNSVIYDEANFLHSLALGSKSDT